MPSATRRNATATATQPTRVEKNVARQLEGHRSPSVLAHDRTRIQSAARTRGTRQNGHTWFGATEIKWSPRRLSFPHKSVCEDCGRLSDSNGSHKRHSNKFDGQEKLTGSPHGNEVLDLMETCRTCLRVQWSGQSIYKETNQIKFSREKEVNIENSSMTRNEK